MNNYDNALLAFAAMILVVFVGLVLLVMLFIH